MTSQSSSVSLSSNEVTAPLDYGLSHHEIVVGWAIWVSTVFVVICLMVRSGLWDRIMGNNSPK